MRSPDIEQARTIPVLRKEMPIVFEELGDHVENVTLGVEEKPCIGSRICHSPLVFSLVGYVGFRSFGSANTMAERCGGIGNVPEGIL